MRSHAITAGVARTPNRAMLRAVGFSDADFDKPIVGVANSYSTITPCNLGVGALAETAIDALRESGTMPQVFGTITVSDGISMGTEGMHYSLVSREVIADSIETVCQAQQMDGVLAIGGCDKNMPGAMIAIARLNIPAIFVYGGTIKPGRFGDRDLTIVSAFEAVGSYCAGKMSQGDLLEIERRACPGAGSCGGMYTANTMSAAIEAMGMSLPGSSTMAAEDEEKQSSTAQSAKALAHAIDAGLLPRHIMTREAFENAIAVVMAIGGSTNAVLHLLAIAHAAGVPLSLDDFQTIGARVPVLCDLKPSGRYVATDLHRAGGIPQVMKMLLVHGLLHGGAMTITGETVGRNASERSGTAALRSGGHPAVRTSAVRERAPVDSARQSRRGRRRREDERRERAEDHRSRARVRLRGGVPRCNSCGRDHEGRRRRHPVRRTERRAGDARDARADVRADRRGTRRLRRPHHRWTFLRRHVRDRRRARGAGSRGGRNDRARRER